MQIELTKHHGLGNDFLVMNVAQVDASFDWSALAQRWCDRHFGVGADGLLLLEIKPDNRLGMILYNADGSRAEMSGNGIRCLVQAAHWQINGPSGQPTTFVVETDAGERVVTVETNWNDGTLHISVDMGCVTDLPEPINWAALGCNPDRPVRHVSMGNPHSVVGVDDVRGVDLAELGQKVPHINLEIIEPGPEPHAITLRVHERGSGITMACGTGACAAAEAAVAWGLVPTSIAEVVVHMDGGDAKVRVDSATRAVTLIGPAVFVASISVFA